VHLAYRPIDRETALLFDCLRGASALVVAAAHAVFFLLDKHLPWAADPSLRLANLAVMTFFVISGFMITSSILRRLARTNFTHFDWTDFARDRLWRLMPPLLGALIIMAICYGGLLVFDHDGYRSYWSIVQVVAAITFLQQMGSLVPVALINGPLWSLSHEFWFYVFAALLTAARFNSRYWLLVLVLLAGVLLAFDALDARWLFGLAVWISGAWLAVGWHRSKPSRSVVLLHQLRASVFSLTGLGLMVLSIVYVGFFSNSSLRYVFGLLLSIVLYRALVSGTWASNAKHKSVSVPVNNRQSSVPDQASSFTAVLASLLVPVIRGVARVAGYSYTLYIIHYPILLLWNELTATWQDSAWGAALSMSTGLVVTLLMARLLGQRLEKRFQQERQLQRDT